MPIPKTRPKMPRRVALGMASTGGSSGPFFEWGSFAGGDLTYPYVQLSIRI